MTTCNQCGFESEQSFQFCPKCGTQQVEAQDGSLVGRTLNGKYRIVEEVGAGSMGTVFRAEHVTLKKRVAIKILHRDLQVNDEVLKRFQREGIAAGQVNHPNAIQIFDFDHTEDGKFFLAMEFVEGQDLKTMLLGEGSLKPDQAMHLIRQLLSTLTEAHTHGIVHRDLKPENLMVTRGASGQLNLKVLDFGLSKLVDRPMEASLMTQTGRVMGTPLYMAPEQWQGEDADTRTDLYSSALILFEMLAGKQPFKGKNLTETLVRSTTEAPPSLVDTATDIDLPDDIDEVIQKALAKERDERYQTAQEMLAALEEVDLEGSAQEIVRPRRARSTKRSGRSRQSKADNATNRTPLLVGGGVGIAALAAVLFFAFGSDSSSAGESATAMLVRDKPPTARSAEEDQYVRLLDGAEAALRRGDPDMALRTVNDALALPSKDPEGLVIRARASQLRGDRDTALADFQEALDQFPSYAIAESGIGWLQLESNDLDDAEKRFAAALGHDAGCSDAIAGQGALLVARGDAAGARTLLENADAADSSLVQLQLGRALLELDDAEAARAAFVAAKRLDGSMWRAFVGLGDALTLLDDLAGAERQYRDAARIAPSNFAAPRLRIVELNLAREQFGAAARAADELASTDVDTSTLSLLRGLAAAGEGDNGVAIEHLAAALASADAATPPAQTARIHELLGALHLAAEQWERAAEHCAAACDGFESPTAYRNWGLAMFQLENYAQAAVRLDHATELDNEDTVAHLNAGIVYMTYLNRPERAVEHFRAFRRAGGRDDRVDAWIERLKQ